MVGRKKEIKVLNEICDLDESSLIAIYGRRRIGKTYLVNHMFKKYRQDCLFFEFTGAYDADRRMQLDNFIDQVYEWFHVEPTFEIKHWSDAFRFLKRTVDEEVKKRDHKEKVIIFLDEVPWIDRSNRGGFLSSLGYFWNVWCEERGNVVLILCGSNSSWIRDKILKNARGSLYQRVTHQISMKPFDLKETREYLLEKKGFIIDNKTVTDLYMVFGGVAKYLSFLNVKESSAENINRLFFSVHGSMYREYDELFSSLFADKADYYKSVIELLCTKRSGFSLSNMAKHFDIKLGAKLSLAVAELEECGFIKGVSKYGNSVREVNYIIVDPYILFHHKWIKQFSRNDIASLPNDYWLHKSNSQSYAVWSGYAFEIVAIVNIQLYLRAVSRLGFFSGVYHWQYIAKSKEEQGAEIDMVVNYGNSIFDILECKYYNDEYVITKEYAKNLKNKLSMFRKYGLNSKQKAELRLVFLTSYGVKMNAEAHSLNITRVSLDELFE
jgi:predicted AAA+ superfamily ATPase